MKKKVSQFKLMHKDIAIDYSVPLSPEEVSTFPVSTEFGDKY